MLLGNPWDIVTCGIDCVTTVLFIPFRKVSGLVHVFDNLSPTDPRVVSTEGNLTLLRSIGNYTHLGAAKIIVEKILKPHALDAEDTPNVVRIVGLLRLHPIVTIGAGVCR